MLSAKALKQGTSTKTFLGETKKILGEEQFVKGQVSENSGKSMNIQTYSQNFDPKVGW